MNIIRRALESYIALNEVLNTMTEDEVLSALQQEADTLRRTAVMDRLIQRAIRLNEIKYALSLKAKYYGT